MPRLIDRLHARAIAAFVGREAELGVLREAMATDPPRWPVLLAHGPGGIGKSALLIRMAKLATQQGFDTLQLDARDVEPTPGGFVHALALALGLPPPPGPQQVVAALAAAPRPLLMIDTFEKLQALEPWLRRDFLPGVPDRLITVLAGRQAPERDWRTDAQRGRRPCLIRAGAGSRGCQRPAAGRCGRASQTSPSKNTNSVNPTFATRPRDRRQVVDLL